MRKFCKASLFINGVKKIGQMAGSGYIRTLKDLAMLRVSDSTLFCILLSTDFPCLSKGNVFLLLAVTMETPPSTSTMMLCWICLVPVRLSPRPSRSIRFGDVSEANGRGKPRQKKKKTTHAFVLFFKMADFTGLYILRCCNKTSPGDITISFVLLRDYFNSLNFYKNDELYRNQIGRSGEQVKKENELIHRRAITFSTKP